MIRFTEGNVLEAEVEALVNTVNTVGVMGKGIALMFKEAFPENYRRYAEACKRGEVRTGRVFVTHRLEASGGPRWIINFPTKRHWRGKSKLEWIQEGLGDLRRVLVEEGIRSVAIPPLGCGNGGLRWRDVRPRIVAAVGDLEGVEAVIYEPTSRYQNVVRRSGVEKLTPARALVAELVRRYGILGTGCTLLEIQKLAWFLERTIVEDELENPLDLQFAAGRYGPYADRLRHLLDRLDGSYLHCERRLADARPTDAIWFEDAKVERLRTYLNSGEAKKYRAALDRAASLIEGFESPLGLELLATLDWLVTKEGCEPTVEAIRSGLESWPGGSKAGDRKTRLFDDRLIGIGLEALAAFDTSAPAAVH